MNKTIDLNKRVGSITNYEAFIDDIKDYVKSDNKSMTLLALDFLKSCIEESKKEMEGL